MADDDVRTRLRQADAELRDDNPYGALPIYLEVARMFEAGGYALKAVAIYKQIREIAAKRAPREREASEEARRRLPALYRQLGLESEAQAIENED